MKKNIIKKNIPCFFALSKSYTFSLFAQKGRQHKEHPLFFQEQLLLPITVFQLYHLFLWKNRAGFNSIFIPGKKEINF